MEVLTAGGNGIPHFSFPRGHCPSLPDVQWLKNHCFIYIVWVVVVVVSGRRIHFVPVTPSWLKAEVWDGTSVILVNLEASPCSRILSRIRTPPIMRRHGLMWTYRVLNHWSMQVLLRQPLSPWPFSSGSSLLLLGCVGRLGAFVSLFSPITP